MQSLSRPVNFRLVSILLIFPLIMLAACDGLPTGKPSTSAPGATSDRASFWQSCDERRDGIDAWEREQKSKIEDEWIDERRGLLQSVAKAEKVESEAKEMRRQLRDNCQAKADQEFGGDEFPSRDYRDEPFPVRSTDGFQGGN